MKDILIDMIGALLIWFACGINRPNDKIKMFSKDFFLQYFLIIAGIYTIVKHYKH